jgi:sterol desaturase/sphingolipid hydroxylase (fatty acid hydroxylase superfamily)
MSATLSALVWRDCVRHASGLVVTLGLILALGVLEWLAPAEQGQTWRGRIRNVGFMTLFQLAGGVLVSLVAYQVIPYLVLPAEPVPGRSSAELVVVILFYMFATDFIFYWYHRTEHAVSWLWAIHALHHSDAELNATSSLRTYLLERPLQFVVISVPVTMLVPRIPAFQDLSLSAREAHWLYLVSLAWLFFAHANLRLELGRWSWMATGPQVHRLHHSADPAHAGINFAQFFPLIDVAFGTYRAPAPGEFPQTGLTGHA